MENANVSYVLKLLQNLEYFKDYDNFTWKFPEKVKYLIIYSINMINNWRQIFILLNRYTKLNGDLIRNLPSALKSELIIVPIDEYLAEN